MDKLQVECRNNSQCTAVAAFLQDPASVLRHLHIYLERNHSFDVDFPSQIHLRVCLLDKQWE